MMPPTDSRGQFAGILGGMSESSQLVGRESNVVPGRFGEPMQVREAQWSRGGGNAQPNRPMLLCLHGWGSNEQDLADMMR